MLRIFYLTLRIILLIILMMPSVYAENVSHEELQKIQKSLENEKKLLTTLDQKKRMIGKELSLFRQRMILLNEKINANQKDLNTLQGRRKNLENQKNKLLNDMNINKEQKQNLMIILQKIAIHPPFADILNPDNKKRKIETAILLNTILPQLRDKTNDLADKLDHLAEIEMALNAEQVLERKTYQTISDQYKELNTMLQKRGQIFKQSDNATAEKIKHIKQLSNKAANLQDLISSLEKNQERLKPKPKNNLLQSLTPKQLNTLTADLLLPVNGEISINFGEKTSTGSLFQGIQLHPKQHSTVVAPFNGKVLFVGPFREYGNIIIIKHDHDLHSLIAGFQEIDSFVGHDVITGEPLGTVPLANQENTDIYVYYELRHKGSPIDPITGLKKLIKKS